MFLVGFIVGAGRLSGLHPLRQRRSADPVGEQMKKSADRFWLGSGRGQSTSSKQSSALSP